MIDEKGNEFGNLINENFFDFVIRGWPLIVAFFAKYFRREVLQNLLSQKIINGKK